MIYPAAFRIIRFVCPLLLLCVSHSLFVCWISMPKQEWGKWEAVVKGEGSLGCRICCLSVKIPLCNCEKKFKNASITLRVLRLPTYMYLISLSPSLSLSHSLTTRSTTQGVTCYCCCCCLYVTASGTCMQRCSGRRCSCCCCSCAYVLLNNCK